MCGKYSHKIFKYYLKFNILVPYFVFCNGILIYEVSNWNTIKERVYWDMHSFKPELYYANLSDYGV